METLKDVSEIAKSSPEPLSREEVRRYFQDMDLSEEQEEMIYHYFQLSPEERNAVPGQTDPKEASETEAVDSGYEDSTSWKDSSNETLAGKYSDIKISDSEAPYIEETVGSGDTEEEPPVSVERLSDSAYYRMYLDEVKEQKVHDDAQMLQLYQKLLDGDGAVQQEIIQNWLMKVIRIAGLYKSSPVNMEDLIQEGNMGLWMALSDCTAVEHSGQMEDFLAGKVREAMESYIREVTGDADWTQAVLAKAALLHEAQELLAKENGQAPSLREMSEYTHIPADEIQDILALYKEENR